MQAAQEFSRQQFPQLEPSWSRVVRDEPDETVVQLTYQPEAGQHLAPAHRYFLVRRPGMIVSTLQEDLTPARWEPFA